MVWPPVAALKTHYRGANQTPDYHCLNKGIENSRGVYCLNVGVLQIDAAVTEAFLRAVEPAGLEAAVHAAELLEADHDAALAQWRLTVERAHYEAQRAERRYDPEDPENRLVARGHRSAMGEATVRTRTGATGARPTRGQLRPRALSAQERYSLLTSLGAGGRRGSESCRWPCGAGKSLAAARLRARHSCEDFGGKFTEQKELARLRAEVQWAHFL